MSKQIITIGRQCGSGGHIIGQEIAQKLGIPFYDKEFLETEAVREEAREPSSTSLLFSLATGMYDGYFLSKPEERSPAEQADACLADLIRSLADQGPCVIVGRCADFILRDRADCLRVFVHGDLEDRVQRLVTEDHLSPEEAQRQIKSKDAMRARHYKFVTDQVWGRSENYHLTLDSSFLGIDRCIELILACCQ